MSEHQHSIHSWGVALTEEQTSLLRETLGEAHRIAAYPDWGTALEDESSPLMIWLSAQGLRELTALPAPILLALEDTPKTLLLDPGYAIEDFETACDMGISDIARPPLTKERLARIMRRTLEMRSIHHDLDCMAREILVERELLERKNSILAFLVNFLAPSTENLNIEELLRNACAHMANLLPITSLHAALWEHEEDGFSEATLYVAAPEGTAAYHAWGETLLDHAFRFSCPRSAVLKFISLQPDNAVCLPPAQRPLLCLPLVCEQERLGILLMQAEAEQALGRDQSLALDSALRHFSLAVKNARRFRQLQKHADYDGLTQVHSRRHFEYRMELEVQRFSRYGSPLSMIMIDIDHFKAVNDTRGHHVGDQVLREVAAVLAASIRNTDYCARYGGEEFAVILPHTDGKKARSLAERIRKRIAKQSFALYDGATMSVTVSLGVACLAYGAEANKHTLLRNADAALYAAKNEGKNKTCLYTTPLSTAHALPTCCSAS